MPLTLNTALGDLQPSTLHHLEQLAASMPGCVSLIQNEPVEVTPAHIRRQAVASLDAGRTHLTESDGLPQLRQAICAFRTERGVVCKPEEVIVTAGATEALSVALMTLLNPGDEVIVPLPAMPVCETAMRLARAEVVHLDTEGYGFQIDDRALAAVANERTKAIVLSSPSSVSGVSFTPESLDIVARFAKMHRFYVVCDASLERMTYRDCPSFAQLHPELHEQTIMIGSFSKPFAMSGWRLGWLCAPERVAEQIAQVHACMVGSIASFAQDAAVEALRGDLSTTLESYLARRNFVVSRLARMGLPCVEPDGGSCVFPSIRKLRMTSDVFCERAIADAGVAVAPGLAYGVEGHIRLSFACDITTLRWGLDRLERFVRSVS